VDPAAAHNPASVAAAVAAGRNHRVVVAAVTAGAAAAAVVVAADHILAFVTGLDRQQAADLHQLQVSHTRDSSLVTGYSRNLSHCTRCTDCELYYLVTRGQLLVLSVLRNIPFRLFRLICIYCNWLCFDK